MRFNVGVLGLLLAIALGSLVASDPAALKSTKPFKVWFPAEPDGPSPKDMKPELLDRLMGVDYNRLWMSKTAMVSLDGNVTRTMTYTDKAMMAGMDASIQLPDRLPVQYHNMMRSWLVDRGSCPIVFTWVDMGKLFWPRWMKTGKCGEPELISCSWPPGMTCIASSVRVLTVLRWHCWLKNSRSKRLQQERKMLAAGKNKTSVYEMENGRSDRNKKKKKNKFRCMWIKVPFRVIEDCACSCKILDNSQ